MRVMNKILPLAILVSVGAQAADNPIYVGARLGGTTFDSFDNPLFGNIYDDQDYGGGVFVGYNFNHWFALEGGYTYLGEAEYKPGSGGFEAYAVDLVGKFTWPLQSDLDLFGKAGGAWYNADNSVSYINDDENDLAGTIGAGLEYFFNDNLSMRAEWQYYIDVGSSTVGSSDIHFYGLSVVYGWGAPAKMAAVAPEPEPVVEEPVPVAKPAPLPEKVMVEEVAAILPFGFNSKDLTPADIALLQPVGDQLAKYPQTKLYVIGHTDSRGKEAYNMKLSVKRAESVVSYLMEQFAISRDRIIVEGRGEEEPIASNDTEAGRAENRRVELFVPAFQVTMMPKE